MLRENQICTKFWLPFRVAFSWGNKSIYLHRSGPRLENGLDRPENGYGRYGFASFSSFFQHFHIHRRGGWNQSFTPKIFFSCSLGGGGRYFSVPCSPPPFPDRESALFQCRKTNPFLWEVLPFLQDFLYESTAFPDREIVSKKRWCKLAALNSVHICFSLKCPSRFVNVVEESPKSLFARNHFSLNFCHRFRCDW